MVQKKVIFTYNFNWWNSILYIFKSIFYDSSFDRSESDQIRYLQISQVISQVSLTSIIIGNGFGEGVPVRDNHLEINYLEIFHKQGIVGLLFWVFIFVHILLLYIKIRKNPESEIIARPFMLSTFFLFFESFTNPFLTNSMGMNVIMVTLVSVNLLGKRNEAYKL